MYNKSRWLVLALVGMAMAVFILLPTGRTMQAATTTVTMLFWPGPESNAMQKVVDWWNTNKTADTGVKVRMINFSRVGFFDKQQAALAAGSKSFDIAFPTTYILGRLAPYMTPLDDYFAQGAGEGSPSTFIKSSIDAMTYNGKLYGIPTDVGLHFLYYRTDLISALMQNEKWQKKYSEIAEKYLGKNLTPKDPQDWTWDDYLATCLFFTKSINPDSPTLYGTALQLKNLIYNIMIWDDVLASFGGNWFDSNGTPSLDSEAALNAMNVYMTIINNSATPPGSTNYEYPETNEAFRTGNVATILQWSAAYHELTDPNSSPLVFQKVGIAPIPAGPAGHKTHVHTLGVGLNAASNNKDEAFLFLSFLATEQATELYAKNGGFPPVTAVLNKMADTRPEFPIAAEHMEKYGFVEAGGTSANAIPIYEILAQELSSAWAGQATPEQALKAANQKIADLSKGE